MKRYRFIYTICVLLVFINISCSDFLDVEDTNPSYTNEGFYTNENAIREAHTVHFLGPDEELELTHRAASRQIFVNGALHIARLLPGRPKGVYDLQKILFGA